jgi:hypothetical protein
MTQIRIVRPTTDAQKTTETTLDTWEITPDVAKSWKLPPFQRPLRVNAKVIALAGQIALDGGVIPGVFCIGSLGGERYLVDGQHRREAFLMSDCLTGYIDVRVAHFKTMGEMAEEFVNLNSRLVNMRPDDIIRGLESSYEPIAKLRKACPFVGYDMIRRSDKAPVVSMSTVLRTWMGSAHDVPHTSGTSAAQLATEFTTEDSTHLMDFLGCAIAAWGKDAAYHRLWSSLNLTVCMWLYRRLVMSAYSVKTQRLTKEQFTRCLMSLSAAEVYVDWLLGRNLNTRDLSPAYQRIKGLFASRLEVDTERKHLLPSPPWQTGGKK